jgi:hypothetical protein
VAKIENINWPSEYLVYLYRLFRWTQRKGGGTYIVDKWWKKRKTKKLHKVFIVRW